MKKYFEEMGKKYGRVIFEGKELALTSYAEFEYRSHANGWQLQNPDNWMAATAIDKEENEYIVWYYIDDSHINDEDLSGACDWSSPSDIQAI